MRLTIPALAAFALFACAGSDPSAANGDKAMTAMAANVPDDAASLVVAGGCFWCVESDFEKLDGVYEAVSGYSGGDKRDATYPDHEGHREAVEIFYDADAVSYDELVQYFMRTIDPTDAGGQFCDRGYEYTTAIYYRTEDEKRAADAAVSDAEATLGERVVTAVEPFKFIVDAEDFHQNYYKSEDTIGTRFGLVKKKDAYKRYRRGCGRDERLDSLWRSTPL